MNRVIIEIGSITVEDHEVISMRVEEPFDLANVAGPSTLELAGDEPALIALNQPAGDDVVKTAGQLIFDKVTANEAIKKALERIAEVAAGEALPVLVRMTPANPADELPWETLYLPAKNSFVGLDSRWPMARVAGYFDPKGRTESPAGPLQMVAVLAALDRSAAPEFEAIYQAATGSGLDFALHVLYAEDAIANDIAARGDARLTGEWVPEDPDELIRAIQLRRPHLLHVFSHGSAQGGFLEIATRTAVGLGDPTAVVYVDAEHFVAASKPTWLTLLNACEGAQPTASGRSFAYAITNQGTAATIGMRREIDATDAHAFAGAFYREAFAHIAEGLAADEERTLDWAEVVRMARNKLLPNGPTATVAAGTCEWTLPVLYLGPGGVRLQRTSPPAPLDPDEERRKDAELRRLEDEVISPEASPGFRQRIQTRIDELRAELGR